MTLSWCNRFNCIGIGILWNQSKDVSLVGLSADCSDTEKGVSFVGLSADCCDTGEGAHQVGAAFSLKLVAWFTGCEMLTQ